MNKHDYIHNFLNEKYDENYSHLLNNYEIDLCYALYTTNIEQTNIKKSEITHWFYHFCACYYEIKKNIDLMKKYYLLAIGKGNTVSMNNYALYFLEIYEIITAEKYFLLAMEYNCYYAANALGVMYIKAGLYSKALEYFEIAEKYSPENKTFLETILINKQICLYVLGKDDQVLINT